MELKGERISGAEHHVWLDHETGMVYKIPSKLGRVWQNMTYADARKDRRILKKYGIPTIPTRIRPKMTVNYEGDIKDVLGLGITDLAIDQANLQDILVQQRGLRFRKQVQYVIEQPLDAPSHPMTYGEIWGNSGCRDKLLDLVDRWEMIYKKERLGLDLLGGRAYKLVGPALDPRAKSMPAEVSNLLIADDTIESPCSWPEFKIKRGQPFVEKGDVLLCDIRMVPLDTGKGWTDIFPNIGEDWVGGLQRVPKEAIKLWYNKNLAILLAKNIDFQRATLWAVLETAGVDSDIIKPDQRFDTGFKRFVRELVHHAAPKMQAYASEQGV
ncbi:hypothetical protein KKA33_04840 [Patescibacteria group bacterium]|nr:hypothetical protein [Patescibacteria group bacterium]